MAKKDVIGSTFGRLKVLRPLSETGRDKYKVVCLCSCGEEKTAYVYSLLRGDTTSCGCRNAEATKGRFTTHGLSSTSEYNTWSIMKRRCYNKNDRWWPYYGEKGITVCGRWLNSFENFYADMGPRPPNTSLDRLDGTKNYTPKNCRWATREQQAQNKANNVNITHEGKTMCAAEWARKTGVPYKRLLRRLRDGWPAERALGP